ncbi:hypothetical protein Csa_000445 [Cucumis sativus]|uniref:Uncharacterized protein n=1 Tax=Cucumis sativus TaxID=3659 RepID=A0A0A0KLD6_CUCSA|nr:hypothetical protein Csa_000445 [Cucumis sativus]
MASTNVHQMYILHAGMIVGRTMSEYPFQSKENHSVANFHPSTPSLSTTEPRWRKHHFQRHHVTSGVLFPSMEQHASRHGFF